MKPRSIQRGIESPHARHMSGVPLTGKVTRLRDAEIPAGGQRVGAKSGRPAMVAVRRRVIVIWSLVLFLVTVMVIGGFMMFWLRGHRSGKSTAAEGNAEDKVRIASKFTAPTEDQALDLVKRALANRDPGELDSLFHLGGSSPAEVIEFIAGAEASDGRVERYSWLSSMDVEGLQMEGVVVAYAGKETTSERLAFLTPTDEGVWKVDFEAFARTSRPPWKDLLEGRAERAQVRVFIAKDEYYNGPFADDSRWVCFGMASLESNALLPEGREMLRGYCEIGSAQAKAMEQLFAGGVRMHRATLELSRPKDADSRQFVISRVLGEDWVVTSKRYDERFK